MLAAQGIEVVGVDVSATAIRTAQEKARGRGLAATFVVGDVLDLGGLGRTFRSVAQVGPRRVRQAEIRDAFAEGWNVERFVPERFNVRAQFMTHRPHAWLATIVRTPTTT